jgi:hypothetical protein
MSGTKRLGAGLLILWLVSAFLPIGCKPAPSTGGGPAPGPGASGPKIQLSDPSAEVVLEAVQDRLVFVVHCKVKYRFIEGAPQSGMSYVVMADYAQGAGFLKIGEGSELKVEGELEDKLLLPGASPGFTLAQSKQAKVAEVRPEPSKLPKQVVFQPTQSPGPNGPFHPAGDKVNCEVKVQASYPVP